MEKKVKEQKKNGTKTIQVRLNKDYYEVLNNVPGRNNSEKVRALIDGEKYCCRSDMISASIELKDAIGELRKIDGVDEEHYTRIMKAEDRLCRLLLTK